MQEQGTEFCLQLLDGPAQRRLGHVEADGGSPDVAFLDDSHEVAQQPQVHHQRGYRRGIGRTEEVLARGGRSAVQWSV
jgi:hypothetical protein